MILYSSSLRKKKFETENINIKKLIKRTGKIEGKREGQGEE